MAAFAYTAASASGEKTKGFIEADDIKLARTKLRAQGLLPLTINEVGQPSAKTSTGEKPTLTKMRTAHWVMATRQLATLLQAKLNIEESLSALVEQTDSVPAQKIFAALRSEVRAGHSLSSAILQWSHLFPEMYRATIRAGEESGQLPRVMESLADYYERRQELNQKILAAFAYPAIVCTVAILVIILLFIFVMPQIVQVFESSKQALPLLTRMMLAVSSFLRGFGIYLIVGLILSFWGFRRMLALPSFRKRWDQYLLRLPMLSPVLLAGEAVRMSSTLAILVGSGVPLLTALQVAEDNLIRLPLKQAMALIRNEVREGRSFSKALETCQCFPPVITYLVRSGEATGDLSAMLERASLHQQKDLESRLNMLTTILGPLLIVVMGGIVGAIVLSVLLPIAEINQVIR